MIWLNYICHIRWQAKTTVEFINVYDTLYKVIPQLNQYQNLEKYNCCEQLYVLYIYIYLILILNINYGFEFGMKVIYQIKTIIKNN